MKILKFIPIVLSILLMLFPLILNEISPALSGLRTEDVVAFISFLVGFLTFSVLSVIYILSYFFHGKVKFWVIITIFLSIAIFEYILLSISAPLVHLIISQMNLLSENGSDDGIFFTIVQVFNSLLAGVIYFLAGRYLIFRQFDNSVKPALILGVLRSIIPFLPLLIILILIFIESLF